MTPFTASDVHEYVEETADGFHFLDPVHRTKLAPHEPPPSLVEDVLTGQGIQYLKTNARQQQLAVKVFHAAHGRIDDFDNGIENVEQLVKAQIFGVETRWCSVFDENGNTEHSSVEYIFEEYPGRLAFQKRQLEWLSQHNILALPCEYPKNLKTPFGQNFRKLVNLTWEAGKAGDPQSKNILYGAYQTTRQWIFIAMLGYWLKQLSAQDISLNDEIAIPIMLGGHRSIQSKFVKYFNIPAENREVVDLEERLRPHMSPNYFEVFDDITEHARITHEQLKSPFM